ncbi:MAG: hypothetical protein K2Y37_11275 [Pirellulales bacterium]|nr:hypothetical protein [Pirellulales bacterium]
MPDDGQVEKLPLVFRDDFARGADHWQPTDAAAWQVVDADGVRAYALSKQSAYKPPHRSPVNISLVRDVYVDDFTLTVRVRSTSRDYGHRDLCLFFGYQGPARFYYVHFGKQTDDHANQIFIVNDAPRTKISTETTPGTPWDDRWHELRIVRRASDGQIDVFFDDPKKPVMRAVDKTFRWGRIGVGSFDDTGEFADVRLYGRKVKPPE